MKLDTGGRKGDLRMGEHTRDTGSSEESPGMGGRN